MTERDNEIIKAMREHSDNRDSKLSFGCGARWADKHPSVDTVKKIICYALKYTNIMLADDLGNGVEWELLIKKAMEGGDK